MNTCATCRYMQGGYVTYCSRITSEWRDKKAHIDICVEDFTSLEVKLHIEPDFGCNLHEEISYE